MIFFALDAGFRANAQNIEWSGTVVNTGTDIVAGEIEIDGTAELTGGGTLWAGGTNSDAFFTGANTSSPGSSELINVDNTILFSSAIGLIGLTQFDASQNDTITLDNEGEIVSDNCGLYIGPNSPQGIINSGIITAENGGYISFTGSAGNDGTLTPLNNIGGVIQALGTGTLGGSNPQTQVSGQSVLDFNSLAITGGTLAATDAGQLRFDGTTTISDAVISLSGSGSTVAIFPDNAVSMVSFKNSSISADGVSPGEALIFEGQNGEDGRFDNVEFLNGIEVDMGESRVGISGTITNTGIIKTIGSLITVSGATTLQGSGEIVADDYFGSQTQIEGNANDPVGSDVFINAGETIAGPIVIGGNNSGAGDDIESYTLGLISFINQGLVTNSNSQMTILNPNATVGIVNSGTIQTLSGGTVAILGEMGYTVPVNNTGGSLIADGTNSGSNPVGFLPGVSGDPSMIYLSWASITGGTISIKNGGLLYGRSLADLSNVTVALSGDNSEAEFYPQFTGNTINNAIFTGDTNSTGEEVNFNTNAHSPNPPINLNNVSFLSGLTVNLPDSSISVSGTLTNTGSINFDDPNNPTGMATTVEVLGRAVLEGGGKVILTENGSASGQSIQGYYNAPGGAPNILINEDNTISGSGFIGVVPINNSGPAYYSLTFINYGSVIASSNDSISMVSSFDYWGQSSGPIQNNGVFEVDAGGLMSVAGNYVQGVGGTLDLDLGGLTPVSMATLGSAATYSHLDLSGTGALNGTFQVSLENGFMPQVGNVFDVLNYSAETGQFSNYLGLRISANLVLQPSYTASGLILTATTVSPGTMAALQNVTPGSSIGVTGGHGYAGIVSSSNLATGNGTVATVLDGTASASTSVGISFQQSSGFAVSGGQKLISDAVNFQGTGADVFVLQIDYNEAMLSAAENEQDIFLAWLNPVTDAWENAVLGNTGNSVPNQIIGPYNPSTDFVLGDYGIDPVDGRVWAVVDHNSEFAAAAAQPTPVPEPGEMGLIGFAALTVFLATRKSNRRRV